MDDQSRRRRHNEQPTQNSSTPRYSHQDPLHQGRALANSPDDRYRPVSLNANPSTPRGLGGAGSYSSYYQESAPAFSSTNISTTPLGYASEYGQDARQQQQSQTFGGYTTATMMYNVTQPNPQTPVYDTQHFGQRQPAAMQMMPQDVPTTYFSPEAGSASASSLQQAGQNASAPTNVFQQTPTMGYSSSIPTSNALQQTPASVDVSMGEEQQYGEGALEEKWINYQRQLGTVFQDIANGSLESASETLLSISSWLLSQVADLGLNLDDASLHADRLKLWNDFNHAWLGLGQRQKEMMTSGRHMSRSQRLLSEERVKKMGDELIRLCDGIERHGLVDYEYGVWEDEIETILEDCLDLFDEAAGNSTHR